MRFSRWANLLALTTSLAACGGAAAPAPAVNPTPAVRPLAGLVSTGTVVVPAFTIGGPSEFGWVSRVGNGRAVLRELDSTIVADLAARGLRQHWVFASDLAASYKRNPGYATDPYALAEEPLLRQEFVAHSRLPEPLASQLRTMIALHDGARLVLLPLELSFWPAPGAPDAARARLKVALVDPRASEALWVGEVRSDSASADPRVLATAVAEHLVDLIIGR